jgi:hypothetical protein
MRRFLQSCPRWLQAGWLLPLVMLALPNCVLDVSPYPEDPPVFDPGSVPQTSAVMCDIPKYKPFNVDEDCATDKDIESIQAMSHAAIGLAEGAGSDSSIALDYSADSTMKCGGKPRKITFHGSFPTGSTICLNCSQIGPEKYADPTAVCVAKCIDLTNEYGPAPEEGAQKYCEANARVATNFTDTCYKGACFSATLPLEGYDDPRRHQEKVEWEVDPNSHAKAIDNSVGVSDMAPPPPPNGEFDSGAASTQTIERGDAWIEFEAKETGVSHVLGVSSAGVPVQGLVLPSISFALSLNYDDDHVYVLENGVPVQMPELDTLWVGQYEATKRFRVVITDKHDGTATISYVRLTEDDCKVGAPCLGTELARSETPISYPLRVFAMFRQRPAQLSDVTMVYIKAQQQ